MILTTTGALRKHIGGNPKNHEVHSGTRELPRAAQSLVKRNALVLLEQKHRDHDDTVLSQTLCCGRTR